MNNPLPEQRCAFCGDPFMPNRNTLQKYCSVDCRYRQARQVAYQRRVADKAAAEPVAATQ